MPAPSTRPRRPRPRRARARRRARGLALLSVLAAPLALAACGSTSHSSSTTPYARTGPRARGAHTAATRTPAMPPAHPALTLPAHPAPRTVRVPILMYHRVHQFATELTKSIPDLTVEPDRFAAEMRALAQAGYRTVTIAQLFDALYRGGRLPPKPVLVSVDDGYVDDVTQILPVLRAEHMTAAFYIITGRFHEPGFVNRAQVRELDAAGMDVGAHTRDHVDLTQLSGTQLASEIAGSRRDLERVLGHPVASFAYPAGRFDQATIAATRQAGFALALTTNPGVQESSLAPFELPRLRVGRATTPAGLLACVAGGGACGGAGAGGA